MIKSEFWICAACVASVVAGCAEPSSSKNLKEDGGSAVKPKLADQENADDLKNGPDGSNSFFVVDHYDPERDAVKDLEMTTALATKSGKHILIEVGGKW